MSFWVNNGVPIFMLGPSGCGDTRKGRTRPDRLSPLSAGGSRAWYVVLHVQLAAGYLEVGHCSFKVVKQCVGVVNVGWIASDSDCPTHKLGWGGWFVYGHGLVL